MDALGGGLAGVIGTLVDMGFDPREAERAVRAGNTNVDSAVNFILGGGPSTSEAAAAAGPAVGAPLGRPALGVPSASTLVVHPDGGTAPAQLLVPCKMVLCVNTALNMSPGKIGAQCAHAGMGLLRRLLAAPPPWLHAWELEGEKTVVLRAEDLRALEQQARVARLHHYSVYDAGRTEVESGSHTILAIAGTATEVDGVTGGLRLF